MSRPTFSSIYMEMARLIAKRSTCKRLQVGTVITTIDHMQVLSLGYNGNAAGLTHMCNEQEGVCGCIHSEVNACVLSTCGRSVIKRAYVTVSPCTMCAQLLIQLGGGAEVIYGKIYRDPAGLSLLNSVGIKTRWLE
jgi:dCMP deaminase